MKINRYSDILFRHKKRMTVLCAVFTVQLGFVNCMLYHKCVKELILSFCAVDGLLSSCMISQCLAGIITPITIIIILQMLRPQFVATETVRYQTRSAMYHKHLMIGFEITVVSMIYAMLISFLIAWALSGQVINHNQMNSVYYVALQEDPPQLYFNAPLISKIAISLCINVLEVYAVVMAAILIYWLSGSKLVAAIVSIIYCMPAAFFHETRTIKLTNLIFDKVTIYASYIELSSADNIIYSFIKIILIILAIYLISSGLIRKKELL